jgi:hypothetical protein
MRRWQRRLRRYWPVWFLLGGLLIFLGLMYAKTTRDLNYQNQTNKSDFAMTVANMSGQALPHVDIQLTWPEDNAELTCHMIDVQPQEVLVRKIFAPAGSSIRVTVTLPNGTTKSGQRELPAGTQGGLRINVHEKGELGLE